MRAIVIAKMLILTMWGLYLAIGLNSAHLGQRPSRKCRPSNPMLLTAVSGQTSPA